MVLPFTTTSFRFCIFCIFTKLAFSSHISHLHNKKKKMGKRRRLFAIFLAGLVIFYMFINVFLVISHRFETISKKTRTPPPLRKPDIHTINDATNCTALLILYIILYIFRFSESQRARKRKLYSLLFYCILYFVAVVVVFFLHDCFI